jgi:ribonuclease III family protein
MTDTEPPTAPQTEDDSPESLPGFVAPHPRALAHLGDAVYELFVREQALTSLGDRQSHALHRYCTHRVCAAYQATWLQSWQATEGLLSEQEQAIVRRARNLPVTTKRRMDQGLYRQATGFEALLGWLHLTNKPRLAQLLATDPPPLEE